MSGNQKQAPSGAPQQQRYQQGTDGFSSMVATTPTGFVPQQTSNQPTNQGPTIRGMAQSGPPNQSSTPPQNDINKMQPPQPGQLQMTFMPQQVRSAQPNYFRPPAPNQGGPRMSNHHRQTMTSTAAAAPPMYSQHMTLYPTGPIGAPMTTYQVPLQNYAQRPYYTTQPYPAAMFPSQYMQGTYQAQQPHAQQFYLQSATPIQMTARQGPPPPVASAPQTGNQPTQQNMPIQPTMPQHNKKKSRSNAVPIINPYSGKDIFDEEDIPTQSDDSTRGTPQPPSTNVQHQLISAEFAFQVAIRASEDKDRAESESIHSVPIQSVTYQSSDSQHHNTGSHSLGSMGGPLKENNIHHKTVDSSLVQNSKLQASTKEFVPEITKHAPKENATPVVSANTEGVEIMLPGKSRERESPAKTRRQQVVHQQQRESVPKETLVIEAPPVPVKETTPVPPAAPPAQLVSEPEVKINKAAAPAIVKVRSPSDNKGPAPVEHRPPVVPQTYPVAEDTACTLSNAKNKGGSQKSKENSASNQIQPSSKSTMPVPGTQPPKQSSKTNKMRDLNLKGASKEGTDMDAFNTAEALPMENCNNEVIPKEEVVEVPAVAQPVQQQPPVQQQQLPQQPPAQKLPDVKTMPKPKVDVTSIVKEVPRPLKPQPQPQVPQLQPTTDSQDETDRAACEKLVQVKNETNISKTNSSENSDNQVIDKTVIRYKKDQWSPLNMDGKKCYDRDFLITLQSNPKCKKKPDNLPDLEVVLKDTNRARMDPRSYSLNRPSEVLMPAFHKSSSQRGPLPKRNSQQGKAGIKGGKPNTIHVTLSLREDVKLRETENAWRPARLGATQNMTEDEVRTAELYKKVRGVLNKLTPEKFERLLNQVRALSIDNEERLQGVIDLVFEKAVDEPNFSVAYALMCKELALMQVPANTTKSNKEEQQFVNFRKLLITRCQIEFEKNSVDENARNLKLKEIDECTDPEKKKELQALLEEEDRRMRVKSVGNIRFIGELFKQQMLTVKIMLRCINILLDNKDEDSLECLCKLLTTVGKDLELTKNQNLQSYFNTMQEIVDKKHGKISSRVRFMLQDVIDLRNSKWVPRRQDLNPKTMEQIQKEADTEQLNIQVMNSGPMNTPRKDDRMGGNNQGGSDRKRRNNQTDDGGWSMAGPRNRTTYTVESSKLMNKPPPMDEITLGSKNLFGNWGRGSNMKTPQPHATITNTANMYAALENIAPDQEKNRAYESRLNKDPYVSKGHSMERSGYNKNYEDGRGSRSGSQHRNVPSTQQQKPVMSAPAPVPALPPKQQLNPEQLKLRMQNIMEEYLNDCCTLKECESDIKASIDPSNLQEFVIEGYNGVLERSATTRRKAGKLFAYLTKNQTLSNDDMCKALTEVLSQADDLVIDIPKLWDYLAEMILPLVAEGVVSLDKLRSCSDVLVSQGHAHKLIAPLLKQLVAESGPNYVVELWQSAGVQFTDFMSADIVDSYVKENKFDFLLGGAGTPVNQGSQSWDQVHSRLLQFFKSTTTFDTVTDWIYANVGDRVKENQFIRTLVTAIVENAVYNVNGVMKLRSEVLKQHYLLLQRFVDNQERLELQCLFALQALVHKWEHPPGLLLSIFERFWEDGLLSNDSFLAWEKCTDPAEQEGKGVALKSMQSLFTSLKEAEDESGSSTSDEA